MAADFNNVEAYRPALTGHCYRMLGSVFDADDAVQETMIRAWRSLERFEDRAPLKSWLYRIATNVCLDELKARGRRARPTEEGTASDGAPPIETLCTRPGNFWIEPMLDVEVLPGNSDPAEKAMLRQSIRLAFLAALQKLPPKQRAALLLTEVVGCSAVEAAEMLDMSLAALNSAVQRARATLSARQEDEPVDASEEEARMLREYLAAFERYDVDKLASLMRQDVVMCMPPYTLWLQGTDAVRTWMLGVGAGCRGSRLVPTAACGWPAFAQYRTDPEGGYKPWSLMVLELSDGCVAGVTSFLDTEALFPRFALPLRLAV